MSSLEALKLKNAKGDCLTAMSVVDHDLSLSPYFIDPDGNPIEVTGYDRHDILNN